MSNANAWWQFISLILLPTGVLAGLTFLPRHQHLGSTAAYNIKRAVAVGCALLICVTTFFDTVQTGRNLGWIQVQNAAQAKSTLELTDRFNNLDCLAKSIDNTVDFENAWLNRVKWNTILVANGSPALKQCDDQIVQLLDANVSLMNRLEDVVSSQPQLDIQLLKKAILDAQNAKSSIQSNTATDSNKLDEHENMFEDVLLSERIGLNFYFSKLRHAFTNRDGEFYSEMMAALQQIHGFEKDCIPAPLVANK